MSAKPIEETEVYSLIRTPVLHIIDERVRTFEVCKLAVDFFVVVRLGNLKFLVSALASDN